MPAVSSPYPMFRIALATVVGLALSAACSAQIYQYKDAQGRTVFSDSPPPGANAVKKNVNAPPPSSGVGDSSAQDKLQEFQKRREERLEKEAKEAKDKAERDKAAENCERARSRLAGLQSGQRIVRFNAQGEREFLDDAGREKEIAAAQKSVDDWCK